MIILDVVKVFLPATIAFLVGIAMTPILTHYLYKHRMWKKKAGKIGLDGRPTEVFNTLHKEREVGTPRFGGIVVWGSLALTTFLLALLNYFFDGPILTELNFLSRGQTWVPLAALLIGSFVGLIDDLFEVRGNLDYLSGGLSLRKRLLVVGLVAFLSALWFYFKLDVSSVAIPFWGPLELGVLFIPFFVFVALSVYSAGIIDGVDGLAGGVFAAAFAAYAGIAFFGNQLDLAAFSAGMTGALLAFLWFNIPPARFYLSETGTMGLTLALTVVAFLADTLGEGIGVAILPIVCLTLVATVLSVVLQLVSRTLFHRKLFLVSPLHHHFEASCWPSYKVTMRYWVVSVVTAIVGLTISLIG